MGGATLVAAKPQISCKRQQSINATAAVSLGSVKWADSWDQRAPGDYSHDSVLKLTAITGVHANKLHPYKGESFLHHLTVFYKSVACN